MRDIGNMGNRKIIGKCSQCGGIVSVPTVYWSVIPPIPKCEKCGAVQDITANLPTIPTIPISDKEQKNKDLWHILKSMEEEQDQIEKPQIRKNHKGEILLNY